MRQANLQPQRDVHVKKRPLIKKAGDHPHVIQMTPTPCHKASFLAEHRCHKATDVDKWQNIHLLSDEQHYQ